MRYAQGSIANGNCRRSWLRESFALLSVEYAWQGDPCGRPKTGESLSVWLEIKQRKLFAEKTCTKHPGNLERGVGATCSVMKKRARKTTACSSPFCIYESAYGTRQHKILMADFCQSSTHRRCPKLPLKTVLKTGRWVGTDSKAKERNREEAREYSETIKLSELHSCHNSCLWYIAFVWVCDWQLLLKVEYR